MSSADPGAWLELAEEDLAAARKLALPPNPHWKAAVYHCQQAAEKAVKAILVHQGGPLTAELRKHDIGFLLERLSGLGIDLRILEPLADGLTDFATAYRYPTTDAEPLTQDIVDGAIGDATTFMTAAKKVLQVRNDGGDGAGGGASGGPPPRRRGMAGPT